MAKRIIIYIALIACCVPLFYLHIYDVHSWGDDFAQYIKEALNIAHGKPYYQSDYIFNPLNPEYGPPQYPAGFPLLLAPVVKIWGLSFKPMFYFISLCLSALIFVLYHFFKHHTKHTITAICLSVICVYSSGVLELKANILSDMPCWLFTAMFITLRQKDDNNNPRLILMIVVASMAILIRSQALLIVVAEGMILLVYIAKEIWKTKRLQLKAIIQTNSFKILTGTTLLFVLLNFIVFAAPSSGLSYYKELLQYREETWLLSVYNNLHYLCQLFIRTFQYFPWEDNLIRFISILIPYGVFTFGLIGYLRSFKHKLTYENIFFTINILLLILLSQRQGVRFILYLLPIFILYAYTMFKQLVPNLPKLVAPIVAILFTSIYIYTGWDDFKLARMNPPKSYIISANDAKAFDYIKTHIKHKDVILFSKPRALSLLTEKRAIVPATQHSLKANKEQFDKVGVNFALLNEHIADDFTRNYIKEYAPDSDSTIIADGYILYHLRYKD